jgi:hypothetical protein
MVSSEIIAKRTKRKKSPARMNNVKGKRGKSMVISNFFPFTNLNLIFAFSIVIFTVIKVIQTTQIGVPKLSIQIVVILLCLLLNNSEAKLLFKKRYADFRGANLVVYPQQTTTRLQHSQTTNPEASPQPTTQSPTINPPMAHSKPTNTPNPGLCRTPIPIPVPGLMFVESPSPSHHTSTSPSTESVSGVSSREGKGLSITIF